MAAQRKFKDRYGLAYPLLSDPDQILLKELGVLKEKTMYGRKVQGTVRSTFLIGADGRVEKAWSPVEVEGHTAEVLAAL